MQPLGVHLVISVALTYTLMSRFMGHRSVDVGICDPYSHLKQRPPLVKVWLMQQQTQDKVKGMGKAAEAESVSAKVACQATRFDFWRGWNDWDILRSFRRFQDDEEKVDTNCSVNLLVTFGWIILKRKVESYHLPHIASDETVAPKNSPGSVGSCWSNPWPSGRRYQEAGGVTFHSIPSIPSIPESVRMDYVLWCKIACSEGAIVSSPFILGIDELGMAYLWGSSSASSKWMEARLVPC